MVALAEHIEIPAPAERVWAVVSEPLLVAACIPGASLTPTSDAGTYAGSIKVKFGPTAVVFNGMVVLSYDHQNRRCIIEGRGRDGRGASNALATGTVAVDGDQLSTLRVDGDFEISGPLETFARTGGVHVARALLAEFARNIEHHIGGKLDGASGAEASPVPADPPRNELRGGSLVLKAFRSWLAHWVRGRTSP